MNLYRMPKSGGLCGTPLGRETDSKLLLDPRRTTECCSPIDFIFRHSMLVRASSKSTKEASERSRRRQAISRVTEGKHSGPAQLLL